LGLTVALGAAACGSTPATTAFPSTGATAIPGAGGLSPCELLSSSVALTLDVSQAGVARGPVENTAEACVYVGDTATLGVVSDAALALSKVPGGDGEQAFLEVEIDASAIHTSGLTYAPVNGIGEFAISATGPDAGRYVSAVGFVKDGVGIDVFTVNPAQVALSVVENVAKAIAAKV
jgi:hypothetical protein